MQRDHLDTDLIKRLKDYGYDVVQNGQGYVARHQHDVQDVSCLRDLDDLQDFADLMEWAAQRQDMKQE